MSAAACAQQDAPRDDVSSELQAECSPTYVTIYQPSTRLGGAGRVVRHRAGMSCENLDEARGGPPVEIAEHDAASLPSTLIDPANFPGFRIDTLVAGEGCVFPFGAWPFGALDSAQPAMLLSCAAEERSRSGSDAAEPTHSIVFWLDDGSAPLQIDLTNIVRANDRVRAAASCGDGRINLLVNRLTPRGPDGERRMSRLVHIVGDQVSGRTNETSFSYFDVGGPLPTPTQRGDLIVYRGDGDTRLQLHTCSGEVETGAVMPRVERAELGLDRAWESETELQFTPDRRGRVDGRRFAHRVDLADGSLQAISIRPVAGQLLRAYPDGSAVILDDYSSVVVQRPGEDELLEVELPVPFHETPDCTAAEDFVGAFCVISGVMALMVSFDCDAAPCVTQFPSLAEPQTTIFEILRSNSRGFNFVDQRRVVLLRAPASPD